MQIRSARRGLGPVIGRRLLSVSLAALAALALMVQADAQAKPSGGRCCFQVSVQLHGTETVNYGDGNSAPYTFYRGRYTAHWRFAFRKLMELKPAAGGSYDLRAVGNYPYSVKSHPGVALHDWAAEWSFSDTPSSVQKACCYTMHPHGWTRACGQDSATVESDGLSEFSGLRPRVSLSAGSPMVVVGISTPSDGAFSCGLNDGRLDPTIGSLWEAGLKPPSLGRLLGGTDFAQACSESASETGDHRLITGSSGSVEVRARFIYFSRSDLYERAKALDALKGKDAPGFNGPPTQPNSGPRCRKG